MDPDQPIRRAGIGGRTGDPRLRDHLIVHNYPPRSGQDPVFSFPPSPLDLGMMIECDLRTLIVVSGGRRYEIRRPGRHWIFDEQVLGQTLDDLDRELNAREGVPQSTGQAGADRQRRRLERLHNMGVIRYEEHS